MRIAVVGCGFVADYYMKTLPLHPEIELVGVYDNNPSRLDHFSTYYSLDTFNTFDSLINDDRVEMVVNLTNPASHYAVSKASLMAGKHVYTEKPLAINFPDAQELVTLAQQKNLYIASAPCSLLGESAQTAWKLLREGKIGKVYLAYAELDDGMIHQLNPKGWKSESGTAWPYKNEFETGCTMEHAGYYLTWLTAFFGPAKTVTSFSACLIPNKTDDEHIENMAPDFSVGCIEFESNVVARITCSIVADRDRSLTIVGEKGTLCVNDAWDYRSPVMFNERLNKSKTTVNPWIRRIRQRIPFLASKGHYSKKTASILLSNPAADHRHWKQLTIMDYGRGIAEMSAAIDEGRPCRMSAEHALHVTELTIALQSPHETGTPYQMKSTFANLEPMPWAENN